MTLSVENLCLPIIHLNQGLEYPDFVDSNLLRLEDADLLVPHFDCDTLNNCRLFDLKLTEWSYDHFTLLLRVVKTSATAG